MNSEPSLTEHVINVLSYTLVNTLISKLSLYDHNALIIAMIESQTRTTSLWGSIQRQTEPRLAIKKHKEPYKAYIISNNTLDFLRQTIKELFNKA